jgi:hypothetical protein
MTIESLNPRFSAAGWPSTPSGGRLVEKHLQSQVQTRPPAHTTEPFRLEADVSVRASMLAAEERAVAGGATRRLAPPAPGRRRCGGEGRCGHLIGARGSGTIDHRQRRRPPWRGPSGRVRKRRGTAARWPCQIESLDCHVRRQRTTAHEGYRPIAEPDLQSGNLVWYMVLNSGLTSGTNDGSDRWWRRRAAGNGARRSWKWAWRCPSSSCWSRCLHLGTI